MFLIVTLCSLMCRHQNFGRTHRLHLRRHLQQMLYNLRNWQRLQITNLITMKMDVAYTSKSLLSTYQTMRCHKQTTASLVWQPQILGQFRSGINRLSQDTRKFCRSDNTDSWLPLSLFLSCYDIVIKSLT